MDNNVRAMQMQSTITCPYCDFKKEETMPANACAASYLCTSCGKIMTPKDGDCCVFCSYGSSACPLEKQRAK